MTKQIGDYIPMSWSYSEPLFYLIRGHLSTEDAALALGSGLVAHGDDEPGPLRWRHGWAARLQTHLARSEGWSCEIRIFDAPGRGRFPVTIAEPTSPVCVPCWLHARWVRRSAARRLMAPATMEIRHALAALLWGEP